MIHQRSIFVKDLPCLATGPHLDTTLISFLVSSQAAKRRLISKDQGSGASQLIAKSQQNNNRQDENL